MAKELYTLIQPGQCKVKKIKIKKLNEKGQQYEVRSCLRCQGLFFHLKKKKNNRLV